MRGLIVKFLLRLFVSGLQDGYFLLCDLFHAVVHAFTNISFPKCLSS